jgi:hypothetical protein
MSLIEWMECIKGSGQFHNSSFSSAYAAGLRAPFTLRLETGVLILTVGIAVNS